VEAWRDLCDWSFSSLLFRCRYRIHLRLFNQAVVRYIREHNRRAFAVLFLSIFCCRPLTPGVVLPVTTKSGRTGKTSKFQNTDKGMGQTARPENGGVMPVF